MTRAEFLAKLAANKRNTIMYTTAQVVAAISSASVAEKEALANAVNTKDTSLIGNIVHTLFESRRSADAQDAVNSMIVADRIDIDDIVANL